MVREAELSNLEAKPMTLEVLTYGRAEDKHKTKACSKGRY